MFWLVLSTRNSFYSKYTVCYFLLIRERLKKGALNRAIIHYHQQTTYNDLLPTTTNQYHQEKSHNSPQQPTTTHYHPQKIHNNPLNPRKISQWLTTTIKPSTTTHYHPEKSQNKPQPPNTTINQFTTTQYCP